MLLQVLIVMELADQRSLHHAISKGRLADNMVSLPILNLRLKRMSLCSWTSGCLQYVVRSPHMSGGTPVLRETIIIIVTRYSCQEARCVCRQAACEGCHTSYLLTNTPDPCKTLSTVGTVLSISDAPRQPVLSEMDT